MKGSLIQLVSYGAENLHLMQDPEITFFKKVYKRHTSFSIESIDIQVQNPRFDSMTTVIIRKDGDLISRMYLEFTLPYDPTLTTTFWTNRVGFNILQKIELYIGTNLVDRSYGLWCHIWSELTHTIDKKHTLDILVGTKGADGVSAGISATKPWKLVVPLMFSFCRHSGCAIPVVALSEGIDISLNIYFEALENCIQTGDLPNGTMTDVKLWVDYIYLERQETLDIVQNRIEYLIEVNQHILRNTTNIEEVIYLPFTLSVKEILWVVQSNNIRDDITRDKFTDFTAIPKDITTDIFATMNNTSNEITTMSNRTSAVVGVQFYFNSNPVFSSYSDIRPFDYFNYVIPYLCHTGFPDLGINAYSFALYPEQLDPSGIINFSALDNNSNSLNIITNDDGICSIFAHSYNILAIEGGEASLVYTF